MRSRSLFALFALFLLFAACSRDTISRDEWQKMQPQERVLYVRSLVGAEKVKDAKGGGGRTFARSAEQYVAEIDAAYARGDLREVHEIFLALEPSR